MQEINCICSDWSDRVEECSCFNYDSDGGMCECHEVEE